MFDVTEGRRDPVVSQNVDRRQGDTAKPNDSGSWLTIVGRTSVRDDARWRCNVTRVCLVFDSGIGEELLSLVSETIVQELLGCPETRR